MLPFPPPPRYGERCGEKLTIESAQSQPHVSLCETQHYALVFKVLGELLQLF